MFSIKEKQHIAEEVEKLLLSIKHPEMPDSKPIFRLHVLGREAWSFSHIEPNWIFNDGHPTPNPWNEQSHEEIKKNMM